MTLFLMLHLQHGLIDSIANICLFIKNWISTDIQCYIIIKSKSRNCLEMSIIFGFGSKNLGAGETAGLPFYPIFLLLPKYCLYFKRVTIFFSFHTHLSSNLALTSLLALRFRAGSLKASLLTADLSRLTSTEYLKIVQ